MGATTVVSPWELPLAPSGTNYRAQAKTDTWWDNWWEPSDLQPKNLLAFDQVEELVVADEPVAVEVRLPHHDLQLPVRHADLQAVQHLPEIRRAAASNLAAL